MTTHPAVPDAFAPDAFAPDGAARRSRVAASPRARRALKGRGIDPVLLRGSGPRGRIVEADVLGFVPVAPPRYADAASPGAAPPTVAPEETERTLEMRAEVDASALLELRARLLVLSQARHGVRVSLSDLLVRLVAVSLRAVPAANRVQRDGVWIEWPSIDVGLSVASPDGWSVPLIRAADRLNVLELAQKRAELVALARDGLLSPELLEGGAISLFNAGSRRLEAFSAPLAPGQSSALAVGRATPRPFVIDGELCIRPTLQLSLCCREELGERAALLLETIVENLENPGLLLFC